MIRTDDIDKYGRAFVKFEDEDGEITIQQPESPESMETIAKIEAGGVIVALEGMEEEFEQAVKDGTGTKKTFDYREF
jgi:hypothetical protein